MPKWLVYALAAIVDFVAAWLFFANGRVVVPAILALAGLCFVFATIGAARKKNAKV